MNGNDVKRNATRRGSIAAGGALVAFLLAGGACIGDAPPSWPELQETIHARFPGVKEITTKELAAILAADTFPPPLLLDVRTEEEYRVSHLKGAVRAENVDDAFRVLRRERKDRLVVAYCSVGYRSAALVADLEKRGITGVLNLEGSIFRWANEGRPVYRDDGRTEEVHPYDDRWGTLLDPRYHPEGKRRSERSASDGDRSEDRP